MSDILEDTLLYDFYSGLLTEKQKSMFEMYYFNDYSLQEISEQHSISRQAVSDILKRTVRILKNYENSLRLLEKHNLQKKQIEDILNSLEGITKESEAEAFRMLKKQLIDMLFDEF